VVAFNVVTGLGVSRVTCCDGLIACASMPAEGLAVNYTCTPAVNNGTGFNWGLVMPAYIDPQFSGTLSLDSSFTATALRLGQCQYLLRLGYLVLR
jgi:hypothetical protein